MPPRRSSGWQQSLQPLPEGSAVSHPAPAQQPGSNLKPTRRARRIRRRLKIATEEARRKAREAEQRAEAAEQQAAALQAELDAFISSWRVQKLAADKLGREQTLKLAKLEATAAWLQQALQQAHEKERSDEATLLGLQQEVARLKAAVAAAEERRRRQALSRCESHALPDLTLGTQPELGHGGQLHHPSRDQKL
ncbi:hypothetical protein ABPG77_010920 [Micractinium sp. CCAP 211/92]